MKTNLGRTVCAVLQNKSGGSLAYGDVVIIDTGNANAVDTTTTSGYDDGQIGVVLELNGIAADAYGLFATGGYVPQINLASSAGIGDLIKTHTVAKQGTPHAAPFVSGDFAQALETGTSPEALLLGVPVVLSTTLNDYILIEDQKAQNTSGGTFTSGAWQTRVLNTEVSDTGGHASLASNQITLAAGTYIYKISAPAYYVNRHKAKLYNITDAADVNFGTSEYSANTLAAGFSTRSLIAGKLVIATSKVFEVQHKCQATFATNGFGVESNFGTEVYTQVELWKVA